MMSKIGKDKSIKQKRNILFKYIHENPFW